MKRFIYIVLGIFGVIGLHLTTIAQTAPNYWLLQNNNLKPISSSWGLQVNSLGSSGNPCLVVGSTGIISTSTCGGGGGFTDAATSTAAGTFTISTTTTKFTITIPPAKDQYFAPTTTIATNNNQLTNGAGYGTLSTSSIPAQFNFPYWANTTGGLSGTSTLTYNAGTVNNSGTISISGNAVSTSTITISTSTKSNTFNVTSSGNIAFTITIPPAYDQYFAPSSTIPALPITVANGGTNKTSFTAGSLVFASGTTILGENNANLFWDNANSSLGIGTNSPTSLDSHAGLTIYGNNLTPDIVQVSAYGGGGAQPINSFYNSEGTISAPTTSTLADNLGERDYYGYSNSGYKVAGLWDFLVDSTPARGDTSVPGVFHLYAFNNANAKQGFSISYSTSTIQNNLVVSGTASIPNVSSTNIDATGYIKINGQPVSTSSVAYPFDWTVGNETSSTIDCSVHDFQATSTITKVSAHVSTAGDSMIFNMGWTLDATSASSTWHKLFTSDQTIKSTTSTALTINGSSTPNYLAELCYYTTVASSSEFHISGSYSTP